MFQNLIDYIHLIITSKYPIVLSSFGVCCISVFYAENSDPIYCKIFSQNGVDIHPFIISNHNICMYVCMYYCIYIYVYIKRNIYFMYLVKLWYFTNLNSSAIWGWFPLLTMISRVRDNSEVVMKFTKMYIYIYIYNVKAPKISKLVYNSNNYGLWYL